MPIKWMRSVMLIITYAVFLVLAVIKFDVILDLAGQVLTSCRPLFLGFAIAFVLNRKVTFQADANPTLSIILYILMVLFTICATTLIGNAVITFFTQRGMATFGDIIGKPFAALLATVWTYPCNRFLIHRKKKAN